MDQEKLYTSLKTLGMPVAYGGFVDPISPPFLTYRFSYSSDFMADGHNYLGIRNFQVELYTVHKNPVKEKEIEDLLRSLHLPFRKWETYLESEKLRQIIYEIQLIGG